MVSSFKWGPGQHRTLQLVQAWPQGACSLGWGGAPTMEKMSLEPVARCPRGPRQGGLP